MDKLTVMGPATLAFKADLVRLYCTRFCVNFKDKSQLTTDDEWAGVECAGVDTAGANIIYLSSNGRIHVITYFADGRGLLEDQYSTVTLSELFRAIIDDADLHPK